MDLLRIDHLSVFSNQELENKIIVANRSISRSFSQSQFRKCNFQNVSFNCAAFADAVFESCSFINCKFIESCSFERAKMVNCRFENVEFVDANLDRATFAFCHVVKSNIARVRGAAIVEQLRLDRKTALTMCNFDKQLCDVDSYRLLLRNMRRTRWSQWYRNHKLAKFPVRAFWWLSDYGSSTVRLMILYTVSIIGFQQIYLMPWYLGGKSLIHDIAAEDATVLLVQVRSLYFSVITSTVGFSYLGPLKDNAVAHLIVVSQVVFAYLIIGAILARIAALVQE